MCCANAAIDGASACRLRATARRTIQSCGAHHAIATLAATIAKADVSAAVREKWLERLWNAYQDDEVPYLEYLGQCWGELCATPELASRWAKELSPTLTSLWERSARTGASKYSKSMTPCLSALYAAGRYDDVLALIARSEYKHKWWHDRMWGAKALAAAGKHAEALEYA